MNQLILISTIIILICFSFISWVRVLQHADKKWSFSSPFQLKLFVSWLWFQMLSCTKNWKKSVTKSFNKTQPVTSTHLLVYLGQSQAYQMHKGTQVQSHRTRNAMNHLKDIGQDLCKCIHIWGWPVLDIYVHLWSLEGTFGATCRITLNYFFNPLHLPESIQKLINAIARQALTMIISYKNEMS